MRTTPTSIHWVVPKNPVMNHYLHLLRNGDAEQIETYSQRVLRRGDETESRIALRVRRADDFYVAIKCVRKLRRLDAPLCDSVRPHVVCRSLKDIVESRERKHERFLGRLFQNPAVWRIAPTERRVPGLLQNGRETDDRILHVRPGLTFERESGIKIKHEHLVRVLPEHPKFHPGEGHRPTRVCHFAVVPIRVTLHRLLTRLLQHLVAERLVRHDVPLA